MKTRELIMFTSIIFILVLLAGCGGGGGGSATPTGSSNWDEMTWDNDNWA